MKVGVLLLVITVSATGLVSCSSVGSGEIGVKTTFGVAKNEALNPGLHLSVPLVDWIAKYDSRSQAVPEEFASLTSDGQAIKITGILNYRISEVHAPLIYTQVSGNTDGVKDKVIQPILLSAIKAVASKNTMTQLISSQPKFADDVEVELRKRLATEKIGAIPKGDVAIVDSFNITGIVLDPQVQEAIEKTAISKQMLQTAENDVAVAKLQAQRNQALDASLTPSILLNDAIKKWDGSGIPPTVGGSQQFLIQPEGKKGK
jgi:regulator of protease activity HflC (stomatin/prohibitin superfamily)